MYVGAHYTAIFPNCWFMIITRELNVVFKIRRQDLTRKRPQPYPDSKGY